ncbi:hypothetical protein H8S45_04630 [Agathobaculum sp. NSJ-28]|uniref:Uncharacterized protein n=1 Tax=Agathobaculum faecis TaxID=2763013 RepID=A0A923LUN1_9FIRM|nr:hypothetical protein [Agathobaculum faecis]MBC5724746.1 hypothetical protein [Agathobaculum faecis]
MNSTSLSVLRYFAKRTSLSVSDLAVICNQSAHIFVPHFKYLLDNGFIEPDPQASDPSTEIKLRSKFCITLAGKDELENIKQRKQTTRLKEIRAWLTLAISLAAFIKSFIFPG